MSPSRLFFHHCYGLFTLLDTKKLFALCFTQHVFATVFQSSQKTFVTSGRIQTTQKFYGKVMIAVRRKRINCAKIFLLLEVSLQWFCVLLPLFWGAFLHSIFMWRHPSGKQHCAPNSNLQDVHASKQQKVDPMETLQWKEVSMVFRKIRNRHTWNTENN